MNKKVLLVDDMPANLSVLTAVLEPEGYEILAASSGAAALKVAARARPDLILLDIMMDDLDGFETCRRLKQLEATREIPVIFITARNEMQSVTEGFRVGGVDYVVKPFQTEEILSRVATHLRLSGLTRELIEKNRALETRTDELTAEIARRQRVETALQQADDQLAAFSQLEASRWSLAGLVGDSRDVRKLLEDIRRLHQFAGTSVLITGESGTGKELIARAIHHDGARARAPIVPVKFVAIPGELAESMLFGHVKGAFTGATSDRKGYFELAHGGTLFLDEVGDMPPSLQVKLLRVLEDGCITPIGGSATRQVDVRIIAATNADLTAKIAAGAFRQDLYFRLARYTMSAPALRQRIEDVPALVSHFLKLFGAEMSVKPPPLSREAMGVLNDYDYPGNVRELKNIIERALIESGGAEIKADHLHLLHRPPPAGRRAVRGAKVEFASSLPLNLAEAEDLLIHRAIQETGGNIADAARMLGIHRTRIYRRLSQGESMAGDANGGQSVSTVPTATIATPETRHASQL